MAAAGGGGGGTNPGKGGGGINDYHETLINFLINHLFFSIHRLCPILVRLPFGYMKLSFG